MRIVGSFIVLMVVIGAASDPLSAACGVANEQIIELEVTTCEEPSDAMMKAIEALRAEHLKNFPRWLTNLELESPNEYKDWLLGRSPGVILGGKVIQSRELDYLGQQGDATAPLARDWQDSSRQGTYFWRGGSCEGLPAEAGSRVLHVPARCCDTIPPSDPECLLNIEPAAELSKWITEAGYHE